MPSKNENILDIVTSSKSLRLGSAFFSRAALQAIYDRCSHGEEGNSLVFGDVVKDKLLPIFKAKSETPYVDVGTPFVFDWYGDLRDGKKRIKAILDSDVEGIHHTYVAGVDPRHAYAIDDFPFRRRKSTAQFAATPPKASALAPELTLETFSRDAMLAAMRKIGNPHLSMPDEMTDILVEDMRNGNFVISGQSVKFDGEGNLIDGWRRFAAALRAGKDLHTLVARGVPNDRELYDLGKKRSYGHRLMEKHGLKTYDIPTSLAMSERIRKQSPDLRFSDYAISLLHLEQPTMQKSVLLMQRIEFSVTVDVVAAVHHAISKIDSESADEFADACFDIFGNQKRLGPHRDKATTDGRKSIYNLASILITDEHRASAARLNTPKTKRSSQKKTVLNNPKHERRIELIGWFMQAYNAWHEDREIKDFGWSGDQAFPTLLPEAPRTPRR